MLFPYIDWYHYVYVTSILIVSLCECWMAHVWGWCNVCKVYFHVRAGRGARGRRRRQGGLRRRVHRHHRRHLVPHAGLHRHARAARQTSVYTRQHRYRTLCTTRHRGTAVLLHARYITVITRCIGKGDSHSAFSLTCKPQSLAVVYCTCLFILTTEQCANGM